MSRSTTAVARARSLFVVLGLAACSLQVPKESEVFSKQSAAGGTSGDSGGGSSTKGGSGTEQTGGISGNVSTSSSGGQGAGSGGTVGAGGATSMGGTSSIGGTTSTTPNPLSLGLVAHYTFDELSGTVVNNAANPAMNGTYVGTVAHPTSGKYGPSASLRNSGTTDYIELPAGLLSSLNATTISLWFRDHSNTRLSSLYVFGQGVTANQLYFTPYVTSKVGNYQLYGTHGGTPFVSYMSGEGTDLTTPQDWHNVVVTWDATAISLYIDGVVKSTVATPTALPSDIDATAPTWIGNGLYIDVDDLRIYDRVLTPELVTSLYNML